MNEASEFDMVFIEYLRRVRVDSGDFEYQFRATKEHDDLILIGEWVIDPRKVLRHLIKGELLSRMFDDDWDDDELQREVKGRLRGGKMRERDNRFGLSDDFWDWWHLHMKRSAGGQDIASKAEADEWHELYLASLKNYRGSAFFPAIRGISFAEQKIARHVLFGAVTALLFETTGTCSARRTQWS